ncbi:phage minor capsid protein [Macrococcus animalis]|uniref:phage minor capsid protein n=1 Tax=Macrococcus animalis TaxID=3395467 RepID=UPI0039BE8D22
MNAEQLTLLIDAMKQQIVEMLVDTDHLNDKEVQKTLLTINNIFTELGLTIQEVLPVELAKSFFGAFDEATEELANEGMKVSGQALVNGVVATEFKTQANVEAITNIVTDSMMDMNAAIRTAKENFNSSYEDTLKVVKDDIEKGLLQGNNREKIVKRVTESFLEDGFTSFTTVDGKRLPLDFYARTVVRTKTRTAMNNGHAKRYDDAGVKLFKITGNEPTCGICARYRNIVFTTDPNDKRFPYIDVYNLIPFHPNCECRYVPFVIEYKSQSEINKEIMNAKKFNPNIDPRAKKQHDAYKEDQEKKRIARQEDKDYIKMKSVLGDLAPKSIGVYRNIKRNNPEKFRKIKNDYLSRIKYNKVHKNKIEDFILNDEKIERLRQSGIEWAERLTDEESKAIHSFTTIKHKEINEYLISDRYDKELNDLCESISSGISKFKLNEPITVYRGISKSEFVDIITSDVLSTFQTFKSTSVNKDIANEFPEFSTSIDNHMVKILIPTNSTGAYIEFNSELEDEMEYLLDKGTRYIINTQESEFEKNLIVLEVLENDN